MKPTVTIIYNVVLAITSVLLLYSYFYVLVYDKDFFTEEHTHNRLSENAKTVEDSSSVNIQPMPASPIKIDTIIRDTSKTTLSKTKVNLSVSTDLEKKDSSLKEKEKEVEPVNFLDMLVVMFLAGMLGGVLANLRGIFEFYREEKMFPDHLFIPYLIRPLTAAISGLLIFFISHLIISSTANPTYDNEYISFRGMVSFMSLAIISGFASQEFTERLKAAAGTLFGISPAQTLEKPKNITEEPDPSNPNPAADSDSDNPDPNAEKPAQNTTSPSNPQASPSIPQAQQKMGKSRYINRD
ncbi:hypothetical protein D1815_20520 [Aquimarina sp. AD1]|uniref:hypothetical protein n=1 Tax=Aquimarina sp. (strain AD1) TaxID=1714848 RepID=UPI000E47E0BB|nr:hypothetical protein [Aquimarina sp. AD1]AXT58023.1 hypothetical protein D1815_20520 [Aquimarina sp. AD1]RKN10419.1 hypothetical protein D7035_19445 [Aquimarina sp. AD1]